MRRPWPGPAVREALSGLTFALRGPGRTPSFWPAAWVAGDEIRTEGRGLSGLHPGHAVPELRAFFAGRHSGTWGRRGSLVARGRDSGHGGLSGRDPQVLPGRRPGVRAARRTAQLAAMGKPADQAAIWPISCAARRTGPEPGRGPPAAGAGRGRHRHFGLDVDGVFAAIMDRIGLEPGPARADRARAERQKRV
jgi:hypothetical protein